jgi:hypothetical protein
MLEDALVRREARKGTNSLKTMERWRQGQNLHCAAFSRVGRSATVATLDQRMQSLDCGLAALDRNK